MAKRSKPKLLEPTMEDEDWLKIIAWKKLLNRAKSVSDVHKLLEDAGFSVEDFKKLPAYKALKSEISLLQNI